MYSIILSLVLILSQNPSAKKNIEKNKVTKPNLITKNQVKTKKSSMADSPKFYTALGYTSSFLFAALMGSQLWEWGDQTYFKAGSDGWMERDQTHGGADKTGHLMTFYYGAKIFTYYFDQVYPHNHTKAAILGAGASFLGGFAVELGDGYATNYGFSYTDLIFDALGVLIALAQEIYPGVDDLIDLSSFYLPSTNFFSKHNENKLDTFTDYSGHLLVLNLRLGGIPWIKETPLKYFRLDLDYYTRCYQPFDNCSNELTGTNKFESRNIYLGFSIDLARLISEESTDKFSTFIGNVSRYYYIWGFAPTGFNIDINNSNKISFGTSSSHSTQ
jgi:Predicted periplasmic lipoprotein (DUF2279)